MDILTFDLELYNMSSAFKFILIPSEYVKVGRDIKLGIYFLNMYKNPKDSFGDSKPLHK